MRWRDTAGRGRPALRRYSGPGGMQARQVIIVALHGRSKAPPLRRGMMPFAIQTVLALVVPCLAGHIGPALRRGMMPFTIQPRQAIIVAGVGRSRAPPIRWGRGRVAFIRAGGHRPLIRHGLWPCHLPPRGKAGRRGPVTAREVRAAAGTSALGVGVGPYGGMGPGAIYSGGAFGGTHRSRPTDGCYRLPFNRAERASLPG